MTLFFLCSRTNLFPIREYLGGLGLRHLPYVLPVSYESFLCKQVFPAGSYLFADMDYVAPAMLARLVPVWDALAAKGYRLFNRPVTTLRRFDLLRTLHEHGVNDFRVARLDEDLSSLRFPVFLRRGSDHFGARSGLIPDHQALRAEITRCAATPDPDEDWMICEFCDTSDHRGVFRKYSAFYFAGTVVPRHLFFSNGWHLKAARIVGLDELREEADYLQQNPHAGQLAQIFSLACVDYGRVDYAIKGGRIQVWEINTNPMITSRLHRRRSDPRFDIHQGFAKRFGALLTEVHGGQATPLPWEYIGDLLRAVAAVAIERGSATGLAGHVRRARALWRQRQGDA